MSSSEEEMLACLKSSVLDENRPLLCSNLDPKLHFPYLRSRYVLSEDDEELIEIQQLKKLKVHKFIDILMKKGRRGFDELIISIIQEKTQIFLAEKLNKAFEEKKKRLHALTASTGNLGTSVGAQELEKIEDLSINTSNGADLRSSMGSQTDKSDRHSAPLRDSWRNSLSDLGVDTEKLPKPVLPKNNHNTENDSKLPRILSCENSFDEDLDDMKSLTDSESFGKLTDSESLGKESKA